jgi:hypothetical protein
MAAADMPDAQRKLMELLRKAGFREESNKLILSRSPSTIMKLCYDLTHSIEVAERLARKTGGVKALELLVILTQPINDAIDALVEVVEPQLSLPGASK